MKLMATFLALWITTFVHAQTTSLSNKEETAEIKEAILKVGFETSECDSSDLVCAIMNAQNEKAYNLLKEGEIRVVKMFYPSLKENIDSYEFCNHFDHYFSLNTSNYLLYFLVEMADRNVAFGMSDRKMDSLGIFSYTRLVSSSNVDKNFFDIVNFNSAIFIFPMAFECMMFVQHDRIFIVDNNKIVNGADFFRKYSISVINKKFKGADKNEPVN